MSPSLPENGDAGSSAHARASHPPALHRGPMPPHRTPCHSGVHSTGMLSGKDRFSSKADHNGGSFCSRLFLSVGNAELMACTVFAVAKVSSPCRWGLSRGKPAQSREGFPLIPRDGGMEREWEKLVQGLLREAGTALLSGGGRGGRLCSVAHLASSSSLPCRVARPCCVATITGEDTSLVILFLSAFSHLPPPLGSASQRWVDGRLSGAAASPTASPACLTKPAQGMLPFWAEHFLLWAQFRGKSLVFGDSSEYPLSSAHSRSREGSWQGGIEGQHSLLPPFQSHRQQFPLQQ